MLNNKAAFSCNNFNYGLAYVSILSLIMLSSIPHGWITTQMTCEQIRLLFIVFMMMLCRRHLGLKMIAAPAGVIWWQDAVWRSRSGIKRVQNVISWNASACMCCKVIGWTAYAKNTLDLALFVYEQIIIPLMITLFIRISRLLMFITCLSKLILEWNDMYGSESQGVCLGFFPHDTVGRFPYCQSMNPSGTFLRLLSQESGIWTMFWHLWEKKKCLPQKPGHVWGRYSAAASPSRSLWMGQIGGVMLTKYMVTLYLIEATSYLYQLTFFFSFGLKGKQTAHWCSGAALNRSTSRLSHSFCLYSASW